MYNFILFFFFLANPILEDQVKINAIQTGDEFVPNSKQGYPIKHGHYTLSYSSTHRQAEFSYYFLTSETIQGGQKRTDDFRIDPKVKLDPVKPTDYQKSGYDRGHLCPAGDMTFNTNAMSETFFMSNMSPMAPSFNRGIWSKLEDWVRDTALSNGGVYVVTGPVLSSSCGALKGSITIPCLFYKVIFKGGPSPKMIGFLLANEGASGSVQQFVVPVDQIELKTGIDFFPQLENTLEQTLESKVNFKGWTF